ncbi:4694_t:CDS:2 [Paraglomus occultum]|uniref:Ceramide glucosyltransferase n=1 Tax=Paraglomus occultum TaxID=144539 RepID=A0A9N9A8J8_9GLOM|nr:4694_t:CDS:2 [Paraglomus occultum]
MNSHTLFASEHTQTELWSSYSRTQIFFMVLSIAWWCFMMGFATLGLSIARSCYSKLDRSKSSQLPTDKAEGVSIIQPLKGLDCNLYENLASSFRQDYPKFEIIFSVADENDPAIKIVKDLIKRYPKVDAKLLIGERRVGVNPKINNIIRSYESAKYDILWVKDSNVYVDPGCLGRSIDKLNQPNVGLIHHLPFAVRPDTFGSELEMIFLNTVHAKMYLSINFIGPDSCVVGKSCVYRKSDLEKVGGLEHFGKYMAEDNLLARALWRKGYKHAMTGDLAYQPLGSTSSIDYFMRRSRWTRIRKYTVTAATVVEPFTESIVCGLCSAYGFNLLWNIHPLNFFAFHLITWFMFDLALFQALSKRTVEVEDIRGFIMAWAIREITALPLYLYSIAGSTVDWRDTTYFLNSDATATIVSPSKRKQHSLSVIAPTNTQTRRMSSSNVHPWLVSILTSIILMIDIVLDILLKSQRNGKPTESKAEKQEKHRNTRKRRRAKDDADETDGNSSEEREMANRDDPILSAAGRYLRSSLGRTSSYLGVPYNEDETDSSPDDPINDASHKRSLFNEILRSVSIGLSMHLQNEKNVIEGQRRSSISVARESLGRERVRGRSMSIHV